MNNFLLTKNVRREEFKIIQYIKIKYFNFWLVNPKYNSSSNEK